MQVIKQATPLSLAQSEKPMVYLPLDANYDSIDAAIAGLASLEQVLRSQLDRRAIFVTAYLNITRAIQQHVAAGAFLDNAWVAR